MHDAAESTPTRTLRGSTFSLVVRLVLAACIFAVAIWGFTVVIEFWGTGLAGSVSMTSLSVVGIVLAVRYVLCAVVLSPGELTARGVFRTRTIRKVDVTGIETKPYNGSAIARLRMTDGRSVGLPMAVQGGTKQMADFVARAWRPGDSSRQPTAGDCRSGADWPVMLRG